MPDASPDKAPLKNHVAQFFAEIDAVLGKVKTFSGNVIRSNEVKDVVDRIGLKWHHEIYLALKDFGLQPEQLEKFDRAFEGLKHFATNEKVAHRKTKYAKIFSPIQSIRQEVLQAVTFSRKGTPPNYLSKIIAELEVVEADSIELSFLKEASACAPISVRASLIMAWSATVARIHRVIEEQGFAAFNQASQTAVQIAAAKKGRYARLGGRTFTVSSRKELTEINDSDLILIVEAMDLYSTQDSKLMDYCLTVRNDSAHPTAFNATPKILELFARGIEQAVFGNAKMKIIVIP
jgi:hypothetical protein